MLPYDCLPADHHEWTPSQAEGAAAALKAGTDLACLDYSHLKCALTLPYCMADKQITACWVWVVGALSTPILLNLPTSQIQCLSVFSSYVWIPRKCRSSVARGLVSEPDVDAAVRRLLLAR